MKAPRDLVGRVQRLNDIAAKKAAAPEPKTQAPCPFCMCGSFSDPVDLFFHFVAHHGQPRRESKRIALEMLAEHRHSH